MLIWSNLQKTQLINSYFDQFLLPPATRSQRGEVNEEEEDDDVDGGVIDDGISYDGANGDAHATEIAIRSGVDNVML